MLEQSLRKLFEQQAEVEPPPGRVTVAEVLRQGRLRRRRHHIGAVGTPVLAAVAVAAIALAGALPSGNVRQSSPQAGGRGRLVGGAFDPSYLAINFGWLPAGISASGGSTGPGLETLDASGPNGSYPQWNLFVYAGNVCHVTKAGQQLGCGGPPSLFTQTITGYGPVIDGHRSLWLREIVPGEPRVNAFDNRDLVLAWEHAPGEWATLQTWDPGRSAAASAVRIARAVQYGQHIPFRFASRFTSLPRGWRIVALDFGIGEPGLVPAGVYWAGSYKILNLRTISPATPVYMGDDTSPDVPLIGVAPKVPDSQGCTFIGPQRQENIRPVTIHSYRFTLADLQTREHGQVQSNLQLCGGPVDGLGVYVNEIGAGAQPQLALSPLQVMERMQLLGPNPADWVTNPMP
jgi:hypothetical protein